MVNGDLDYNGCLVLFNVCIDKLWVLIDGLFIMVFIDFDLILGKVKFDGLLEGFNNV